MAVIEDPKSKKCFNECPNCGATDPNINWGNKEWLDDGVYQDAECNRCGCYFKEYYRYTDTEFEVKAVPRVKCKYPLSRFYIYMDEVPGGDRVSTPEECEKCEGKPMCANNNHCLIHTDNNGHETKNHRTKL